ncbi:hypothetical protein B0H63DRAFT_564720 [Podospora didyma]|uniref:Uncharacterized protein n=1 Tax=Podospora didyma TaxID=330526 RepID=A0AAE0K6J9_9PEZI|nr:hypothetical protein B0H63DRAFT_564720 [Podospora didyma]
MSTPTGIVLNAIRVVAPTLNIRSSNGVVNTTVQHQTVWSVDSSSTVADGEGSYFPASKSITVTGLGIRLALDFTITKGLWKFATGYQPDAPDYPVTAKDQWGNYVQLLDQYFSVTENPNEPDHYTVYVGFAPTWAIPNGLPWGYAGDVTWNWSISGYESFSQVTRLEFYSLCETLPSFYHGVVPVGFLRAMVLPARLVQGDTWTDYVVNSAFSRFGFQYDIGGGNPKYTNGYKGWSFDLQRWVRGVNRNTYINCYDQAAILEVALGLGPPVDVQWIYMMPYGFINTTTLVGYPNIQCNNPIAHTPNRLFLEDNNDPTRTMFSNHAFVIVNKMVLDACAGPHTGTETLEAYIAKAIQPMGDGPDQTTCYSHAKNGYRQPGTSKNAVPYRGILALDICDITNKNKDKSSNSIAAMKTASANMTAPDTSTYAVSLPALQAAVGKVGGHTTLDVFVGSLGVEMVWDIFPIDSSASTGSSNTTTPTEITMYVCQSNDRAAHMFENDLHNSQAPNADALTKPSGADAAAVWGDLVNQLMLISTEVGSQVAHIPVSCFVSWVRGNVCVVMSGSATSAAELFTQAMGLEIDNAIKNAGTLATSSLPPLQTTSISVAGDQITTGSTEIGAYSDFKLTIDLNFNSDYFHFVDTLVNNNTIDEAVAMNPIVMRDAAPLPSSTSWVFTLATGPEVANSTTDHPLEFVFAERETSRVLTVKLTVVVINPSGAYTPTVTEGQASTPK